MVIEIKRLLDSPVVPKSHHFEDERKSWNDGSIIELPKRQE